METQIETPPIIKRHLLDLEWLEIQAERIDIGNADLDRITHLIGLVKDTIGRIKDELGNETFRER